MALLPSSSVGCAHQGGHRPAGPAAAGDGARVELVAGGASGGDGSRAAEAKLYEPFAVARHPGGDLYIVEMDGSRIRRVDGAGIISTVAGTGDKAIPGEPVLGGDGPGRSVRFNGPHHLIFPPSGHPGSKLLYIADTWNNKVRTLDPADGQVRTLAGAGAKGFGGDEGPASEALFAGIFSIDFDRQGERLFIADLGNRRIRVVHLGTGKVSTVAGNGEKGVPEDGALAREAPLVDPRAVAVDSAGRVYILERNGHALRVVAPDGKIRTVAGTGQKGNGGDGGPARQAVMNGPKHLTVDRDDSVLIVDTENHNIRRYTPVDGRMTLVAGTGRKGAGGLGGSPQALEMARPHGVYVDHDNSLLISDSDNHRVLRIRR